MHNSRRTWDDLTCSSPSRGCSPQCRSWEENPSNLVEVIASAVRPCAFVLTTVSPGDKSTSDCPTPVIAITLSLTTDTRTSVKRPCANANVQPSIRIPPKNRQTAPLRQDDNFWPMREFIQSSLLDQAHDEQEDDRSDQGRPDRAGDPAPERDVQRLEQGTPNQASDDSHKDIRDKT